MPHTRAMGGGLFEVRAKGREGIGRAFFCTVVGQRIVILHVFTKKTDQTPARELDTARKRDGPSAPASLPRSMRSPMSLRRSPNCCARARPQASRKPTWPNAWA